MTSWLSQEPNLNGECTEKKITKMPTRSGMKEENERMMNDFVKQNLTRPSYFSELIIVVLYKFIMDL